MSIASLRPRAAARSERRDRAISPSVTVDDRLAGVIVLSDGGDTAPQESGEARAIARW